MLHSHNSFHSLLPGLGTVRRELEKAFDEAHTRSGNGCGLPSSVSIWQDDEQVFLEVDVPGYSVENLSLSFEDGNLKVTGERQWPEGRNQPDFNERRFGKFERIVSLPDTVDASTIDAGLSDGVLSISFRKKVEAVPRSVQIEYRGKNEEQRDES